MNSAVILGLMLYRGQDPEYCRPASHPAPAPAPAPAPDPEIGNTAVRLQGIVLRKARRRPTGENFMLGLRIVGIARI